MTTHAVYRFFNAGGVLLYIGITMDPSRRWKRHAGDKEWWHEVDQVKIEKQPSREAALAAESAAIQVENPRYNIQHAVQQVVRADSTAPFKCECGAPGTAMYVLYSEIAEHRAAMELWKVDPVGPDGQQLRVLSMSQFLDMPDKAKWRATCDAHVPEEEPYYWFDMPKTWKDWLLKTAHLLDTKSWVDHTNWAQALYGIRALHETPVR
jgi:predicted GIY-YIG superfamily endonuclease